MTICHCFVGEKFIKEFDTAGVGKVVGHGIKWFRHRVRRIRTETLDSPLERQVLTGLVTDGLEQRILVVIVHGRIIARLEERRSLVEIINGIGDISTEARGRSRNVWN